MSTFQIADVLVLGCLVFVALGWLWLVVSAAVAEVRQVLSEQRAAGGRVRRRRAVDLDGRSA